MSEFPIYNRMDMKAVIAEALVRQSLLYFVLDLADSPEEVTPTVGADQAATSNVVAFPQRPDEPENLIA